jgi:hypothetical protein
MCSVSGYRSCRLNDTRATGAAGPLTSASLCQVPGSGRTAVCKVQQGRVHQAPDSAPVATGIVLWHKCPVAVPPDVHATDNRSVLDTPQYRSRRDPHVTGANEMPMARQQRVGHRRFLLWWWWKRCQVRRPHSRRCKSGRRRQRKTGFAGGSLLGYLPHCDEGVVDRSRCARAVTGGQVLPCRGNVLDDFIDSRLGRGASHCARIKRSSFGPLNRLFGLAKSARRYCLARCYPARSAGCRGWPCATSR